MKIKAAVCYELGQPLVVEEIAIDPPGHGEVRVRLVASGICHSDIHLIRGDWGAALPVVAGHEGAGVVESVGAEVTHVKPGDHVIVSLLRSCGRCFYCTRGAPHNCEGNFALASEHRLHTLSGVPIQQGTKCAAFAEYVVADQSQVVPIPTDFPFPQAALLACGVITGFGAVTNTAAVPPGSSVAVIGIGGVGVNALQGAAIAGAHPIVALDMLDEKLATAQSFGATHAISAADRSVTRAVKQLTAGRGVDFAFVTVGSTSAMEQALRIIRQLGTVVLVGLPHSEATMKLPAYPFVLKAQRIVGSFMGSAHLQADVQRLVELYREGRYKLDELITARYRLEQINDAIVAMETGAALRNVIVFEA